MLPVSWALTLVSLYITLVLPIVGMRSVLRLVGGRFAQIWVIDTPGHYSIVSRSVSLDSMKIFSQIVTEAFYSIALLCIAANPHLSTQVPSRHPEKA